MMECSTFDCSITGQTSSCQGNLPNEKPALNPKAFMEHGIHAAIESVAGSRAIAFIFELNDAFRINHVNRRPGTHIPAVGNAVGFIPKRTPSYSFLLHGLAGGGGRAIPIHPDQLKWFSDRKTHV